jgi:subtilase family serine protease
MGKDFRAAYAPGVSLNGSGQAVGLLEFEGYYQSDITNYEGASGYTNVTLTNVLVDDATGVPDSNALHIAEVSADIEMAIAMAPGLSQVMVYEVSPSSIYPDDMLSRMATDNIAKQLSSSWNFGTDENTEQTFLQFVAQGQSFFDASGDVGAYTGGFPIRTTIRISQSSEGRV